MCYPFFEVIALQLEKLSAFSVCPKTLEKAVTESTVALRIGFSRISLPHERVEAQRVRIL